MYAFSDLTLQARKRPAPLLSGNMPWVLLCMRLTPAKYQHGLEAEAKPHAKTHLQPGLLGQPSTSLRKNFISGPAFSSRAVCSRMWEMRTSAQGDPGWKHGKLCGLGDITKPLWTWVAEKWERLERCKVPADGLHGGRWPGILLRHPLLLFLSSLPPTTFTLFPPGTPR